MVLRIFPENTNLFGIFDRETQNSLPVLSSGLHPRQCDNDGLRPRAASVLHQAENDLDDFGPDLDTLDERANQVSTAMPVRICRVWPNGCREFTKTARRKSQVFQLIDITCASCTVSITFTPTAKGSRVAVLNVADSASTSPQTVNLSGTGK